MKNDKIKKLKQKQLDLTKKMQNEDELRTKRGYLLQLNIIKSQIAYEMFKRDFELKNEGFI